MDERKLIKISNNEKFLDITWQVNNFCNFKCSYCNPGNYSGTDKNNENLQGYLDSLQVITDKYRKEGYENFKMFFSGGEPTLWKNLIPICEWAKNTLPNVLIAVNTNFSRPLNWWKQHYHLFDDVVASFHVEFSDKEKYKKNALFMYDKLNYFSCKMLMHEERFWEVVEFGEDLKKILPNYFIEWTPLYDELSKDAKPWEYKDPEKVKFLEEHSVDSKRTVPQKTLKKHFYPIAVWNNGEVTSAMSNELIIKRQNFFKGWECSIGDSIWINQQGNISMGTCGQVENFGYHMMRDTSKIGPKKIICGKEHCMCGTDILIPKQKLNV